MLYSLLALQVSLAVAAPPAKPPPGAEVVLEASAVLIPSLPSSVAEARRGFSRVRKELDVSYREAERYLAACAAELAAPPPAQITLPAAFGAEATVLSQFLFDQTFLDLEGALLERWNPWQSFLLRQGMAQPAEAQRMAEHMLLLSSSKAEVAERASPQAALSTLEILSDDPVRPGSSFLKIPRMVRWFEVVAVDRMEYGANTEFSRKAAAYADGQAPALAQAWSVLSAHLNASASALLDLDRTAPPTRDPGMRILRLQARINFMERFRSTLWFCQVVWAHMASQRVQTIHQM